MVIMIIISSFNFIPNAEWQMEEKRKKKKFITVEAAVNN